MSVSVLLDTNVLVYAYDRTEPWKQQRALEVLDLLVRYDAGAVTTQVLAEFFVVVTRKLKAPLSAAEAYVRIEHYLQIWPVYDITGLIVLEAARGVRDHQMSFWDAQIWATAHLNQVSMVFSEDFQVGSLIEGVRFINPFDPAFRLGVLFS